MKQNKQILLGALAAFVAVIVVVAGLWVYSVYVPVNSQARSTTMVVVKPGSSMNEIAQTLRQKNLVSSAFIFTIYARLSGKGERLIPGTYALKASMNMPEIITYLASGKVAARKVVIPEGYSVAKIAQLWSKLGFGSTAEFTTAAQRQYDYAFLPAPSAAVPYQVEGYLFPATYQVALNATPEGFIRQMLTAFQQQALPKLTAGVDGQGQLKTTQDVVTLASLVELEANDAENRAKVAGVFLNRLARGMALESDVTVIYATGNVDITAADLRSASPYNTRLKKGMPPGPICSPGIVAIDAVLNPTKTDYIFFLAGNDGQVYYAKTLLEHNQNIARYLK